MSFLEKLLGRRFAGHKEGVRHDEGVRTIGFEGAAIVDIDLVARLSLAVAGCWSGDFNVQWFVQGEGEGSNKCGEGEE